MKIFATEKLDGLEERIKASASIAMTCRVLPNDGDLKASDEAVIAKIVANSPSNPDQKDLYYLNSVLVSTGWNKNDDVFDPGQAWAARFTPVDKQFNFMHDENDIIGHITGSIVLDGDGNDITTQEDAPEKFDIITSAVVYTAWSDEEQKERITALTKEIDEGKWAVSMECLFNDFDYAVITPEGEHKVIARDETSAFLTKHLRCYGGTGKFEEFTLGRQLKNITFSGKGLVDNPANPRSIIFDKDVEPFKATSNISVNKIKAKRESTMTLEQLQADNDKLKAELEKLRSDAADAAKAEFTGKIEDLESAVAEKDGTIADLQSQVETLEGEVEAKDKENKKFKEEIDKKDKEAKDEKRKAQLIEAGMTSEDATTHVETYASVDDDTFATIVKMVADKTKAETEAAEAKKAAAKDEEEAEADDKSEEEAQADDGDAEEEAEAEADKDALEDAETTEASMADSDPDEGDERQKAVAATSSWLSDNVLKSTRNMK